MNLNVKVFATAVVGFVIALLMVVSIGVPMISDSANNIAGSAQDNGDATVFYSDAPANLSFTHNKTYTVDEVAQGISYARIISDVAIVTMDVGVNTAGVIYFADGTSAIVRNVKIAEGVLSYSLTTSSSTYVDLPCSFALYSVETGGNYAEYSTAKSNTYQPAYTYVNGSSGRIVAEVGVSNEIVFTTTDATEIEVTGYGQDEYVISWDSVEFSFTGETADLSSSMVIVEKTYHENPVGLNASTKALIEIVPLLLIVGLAVAAVRVFIARE